MKNEILDGKKIVHLPPKILAPPKFTSSFFISLLFFLTLKLNPKIEFLPLTVSSKIVLDEALDTDRQNFLSLMVTLLGPLALPVF